MFKKHSVAGRVATGKVLGLVFGLIVIVVMPTFGYPGVSFVGFGLLLMFMLMGVMIGFLGQFDRHPLFDFKMSWWLAGPVVGFAFMLMFVLFAHDSLEVVMQSSFISWTGLSSPFWALVDGIFIGGIMGFVETKIAGEGSDLPLQ